MNLRLQPVKVGTGSADQEGQLVFVGDFLVAVLVRLSDQHESRAGTWYLEAAFGRAEDRMAPLFADLSEAQYWISKRLDHIGVLGTKTDANLGQP